MHRFRWNVPVILTAVLVNGLAPEFLCGQSSAVAMAGGQATADHYSTLTQINRSNVKQLREAWSFDLGSGEDSGMETNPLVVGRTLYGYTATQKVFALDAASGKLLWRFDSGIATLQPIRGLAYWTDGH